MAKINKKEEQKNQNFDTIKINNCESFSGSVDKIFEYFKTKYDIKPNDIQSEIVNKSEIRGIAKIKESFNAFSGDYVYQVDHQNNAHEIIDSDIISSSKYRRSIHGSNIQIPSNSKKVQSFKDHIKELKRKETIKDFSDREEMTPDSARVRDKNDKISVKEQKSKIKNEWIRRTRKSMKVANTLI